MDDIKRNVADRLRRLIQMCPGTVSENFVISSGCALALLGLRKTFNDIDVSVGLSIFEKLIIQGYEVDVKTFDKPVIQFHEINIDVHLDPEYMDKPTENIICCDNVVARILAPEALVEEKEKLFQKLHREKDKIDVEALKAFICRRRLDNEI